MKAAWTAGAFAAALGTAWAAPPPFAIWDRNDNGVLTPAELTYGLDRFDYFDRWDADDNGIISLYERRRFGSPDGTAGDLDQSEWADYLFLEADVDDDGLLTPSEWLLLPLS